MLYVIILNPVAALLFVCKKLKEHHLITHILENSAQRNLINSYASPKMVDLVV
jgi:hypothetical protein